MRFQRFIVACVGLLSACAIARSNAPELSLDDVIAKHIEALGGMEKIRSLKTLRVSGTISEGASKDYTVLQEWKRTNVNQMRMEIQTGGVKSVRVYDGKDGWQLMPELGQHEPTRMTEDELRDARLEANVLDPLINYKERGLVVELLGIVQVEDRNCYKIRIDIRDSTTLIEYIDAENFLEPRTELTRKTQIGDITTNVDYSDCRKVDGLIIPFKAEVEILVPKQPPQHSQFQADKVEVNPQLNDSDFAMPPELEATSQPSK